MVRAANLGFPRIGRQRELKRALESYWSGTMGDAELQETARLLREEHWRSQLAAGIDDIPSNDFSLYDHVLDTAVMLGLVDGCEPTSSGEVDLDAYFAHARGGVVAGRDVSPWPMTKWFDTNYHYLVPDLAGRRFSAAPGKAVAEFTEALALGITTRPVLLGPLSFLRLCGVDDPSSYLRDSEGLISAYEGVLDALATAGASTVQVDEPALVLGLDDAALSTLGPCYARLAAAAPSLDLLVATYFAGLGANLATALSLPVAAIHLDLVADPGQLERALGNGPKPRGLSLGIVDGRNIWRSDLEALVGLVERVAATRGTDSLQVAPSCSLLHLPYDASRESAISGEVRSWLAFAQQRLEEVAIVARALNDGREAVASELNASSALRASRLDSPLTTNPAVRERLAALVNEASAFERAKDYGERSLLQRRLLDLPIVPTTSIGSLPQTADVRRLRAKLRKGDIEQQAYDAALQEKVVEAIAFQEDAGLDVLVHGEFERNDMVEYFAEHLDGFAVTEHAWVQSYGSRCVKPPILYGDVQRVAPITLDWFLFAQSLTPRPVKGMLTGPITMAAWSFVRDDIALEAVCRQLALAVREEVGDLEAAGARIVQVDEPALREGLPLHRDDWAHYLDWACAAFRLASSGVADSTQIHTHMCYVDFAEIIGAIAALDADVISIEASRSRMTALAAFNRDRYPNAVGPGLFDVHSPRVPEVAELVELLELAIAALGAERVWANPDCGLKTRRWEEVRPALANLVLATQSVRKGLQ